MKMKLSKLSVAVLLATASLSASAVVVHDGTQLGTTGDLVLVIQDNTAGANFGATFVTSLGINVGQLSSGAVTNGTWNLLENPLYSSAFGSFAGHNLSYYVAGSYAADLSSGSNFDPSGVVAPYSSTVGPWGAVISAKNSTPPPKATYDGLDLATTQKIPGVVNQAVAANILNSSSARIAYDPVNGSLFNQFNGFAGTSPLVNASTDAILANTGNGASSLGSLYFLTTADFGSTFGAQNPQTGTSLNLGTLSLDSTTGILSFGATPVPVPAAVWLFGSALCGLIGFGRRNEKKPVA